MNFLASKNITTGPVRSTRSPSSTNIAWPKLANFVIDRNSDPLLYITFENFSDPLLYITFENFQKSINAVSILCLPLRKRFVQPVPHQ
jgi:hypothetical protein